MKKCTKCHGEFLLSEFANDARNASGIGPECKKCKTERTRIQNKKRRHKRKRQIIKDMGGQCSQCGITGPPCIFDFHHIGSVKENIISQMLDRSLDKLIKEIENCILLCANCHRIIHSKEQGQS